MVAHGMNYTKQNYLIMNCISLPRGVGVVLKITILTLNVPKYVGTTVVVTCCGNNLKD